MLRAQPAVDRDATDELLATHYHRRARRCARGFTVEHRKRPRGWNHALAARDPATGRSLLPRSAMLLLDMLEAEADPVPASTGARRVFGHTLAFYAMRLGFSVKRDDKGEAHGARRVRELLRLLEQLHMVTRGGRAWFNGPGRFPRLVLWVQPWERWAMTRYAEAGAMDRTINVVELEIGTASYDASAGGADGASPSVEVIGGEQSTRISRSGCFTDPVDQDSGSGGGMGGVGGKEEAPEAPVTFPVPALDVQLVDVAAAEARDGGRASGGPPSEAFDAAAAFATLGATALRTMSGAPLRALMAYVARTRPNARDAADGRDPRARASNPRTRSSGPRVASAATLGALLGERPHANVAGKPPCTCDACGAWARALIAAPAPRRAAADRVAAAPVEAPQPSAFASLVGLAQAGELGARLDAQEAERLRERRAAAAQRHRDRRHGGSDGGA